MSQNKGMNASRKTWSGSLHSAMFTHDRVIPNVILMEMNCGTPRQNELLERSKREEEILRNEFTAILEKDGDWFIAYCLEIPGANGQGHTQEEAKKSLADAIELILQDRREDGIRGIPEDAVKDVVSLG